MVCNGLYFQILNSITCAIYERKKERKNKQKCYRMEERKDILFMLYISSLLSFCHLLFISFLNSFFPFTNTALLQRYTHLHSDTLTDVYRVVQDRTQLSSAQGAYTKCLKGQSHEINVWFFGLFGQKKNLLIFLRKGLVNFINVFMLIFEFKVSQQYFIWPVLR